MKIPFLAFTCSKRTSVNYTLDILFYKNEIEIKKHFSAILTKSKKVMFSLLFSIDLDAT